MQKVINSLETDAAQLIKLSDHFGRIFSFMPLSYFHHMFDCSIKMKKLINIVSKLGYNWNQLKEICNFIAIKSKLQIFHCFIAENVDCDTITKMLKEIFGNNIQIEFIVKPIVGFMIYTPDGLLFNYTQEALMRNIDIKLQKESV